MTEVILTLLVLASVLAPVPADPPPDPLAWGYLGVRVATGSLMISQIEPNTPAARAGLRVDDDLIEIGSLKPHSFDEVAEHIATFRPGTVLRVVVRRGAETKAFTIRLGVRPPDLPTPVWSRRPLPHPDR
jgi:S1-C subfamily serine protease